MTRRKEPSSERAGVRVGHWTDLDARTGCTVVLFDRLVPTVVDVRGGAPGTRETDLLRSDSLVRSADAILLSGGSAFGLAAADGVVHYLKQRGRGFPTQNGAVPIVPAAIIYDLAVGRPEFPDAKAGFAACLAAAEVEMVERGNIGAGAGAVTAKMWSDSTSEPGGFGYASAETPLGTVHAFMVVNSAGEVAPAANRSGRQLRVIPDRRIELLAAPEIDSARESTTVGAIVVDGPVDYRTLQRIAIAAQDGIARAIRPSHTVVDGDVIFASGLATGSREVSEIIALSVAAELAVEGAIRDAVQTASS